MQLSRLSKSGRMNSIEDEQKENKIDSIMETIDLSSSTEIDQFSKALFSVNMDENSEVEFRFLSSGKKILTSLWKKIIQFKRVVQDHCIRIYRGDEIERTRVYHVWPGNNVFFFRGRLICGPDPRGLILSFISICLSSWTFAVHVANDIGNQSIIVLSSFLTVIVLINLGFVSTIDPGIIPRNFQISSVELSTISTGENRRRSRVITVNGIEVKLKYCRICNIYRPPRCCHCAVCNNCIEQFDHHCPWIGHCIGLRNYRLYVVFLFTGLALFAFIFIFACKSIHHKLSGDGIGVLGLLSNWPETLALTVFSFAAMCFLAGLSCYHVYLMAINQTAYEHFHQKYVSIRNPYDRGVLNNIKEVLLSSQPPPRVNFRADMDPRWFDGCSDININ